MSTGYVAPVADLLAALRSAGLDEVAASPRYADVPLDAETIGDLLSQFGRLASGVVAASDAPGDRQPPVLDPETGAVTTPPEIAAAWRAYAEGGWQALAVPAEHGGAGLPLMVRMAVEEMLTAANLSLSLLPVLSLDAVELLVTWGTDEQRARYLPPLLHGRWSGTMLLTEPEAGSDVGALRTRAEPDGDGGWRLTGRKIFITWGEHDLTENIVHAVLARTPGSPPGTRGLSLFLVPKHLVDADGGLGARNPIRCIGLERKLGLHASPTCVMELDGAVGELVGEERQGMRAMFTMMNAARLSMGAQGVGVTERAFQQALGFAHQRVQGRTATSRDEAVPIVAHPDVRRMLGVIRAGLQAMRLLVLWTARWSDVGDADRVDLLTPLAKAWPTDLAVELTSLAIQVHGGVGYVEETGIAQRLRDVRIASIYEGTNGIQAIDLVSRKLPSGALEPLLAELAADTGAAETEPGLAATAAALAEARAAATSSAAWLLDRLGTDDALAGATPFLRLLAATVAGHLLARQALADPSLAPLSEVFALELLRPALGGAAAVTAGAGRLDGILPPTAP